MSIYPFQMGCLQYPCSIQSIFEKVDFNLLGLENEDMCFFLAHGNMLFTLFDEDGLSGMKSVFSIVHFDNELTVQNIDQFIALMVV